MTGTTRRRRPASPLRIARKIADLTLRELADRAGLSKTSIYLLEHDQQQPLLDTAQRLARALDTSVEALFPLERRSE